ncbi:hypothetical protein BKG77_06905 [Mycobacteroides chelonae]|uniref:hypothetical protein n=1 Tax=Mycobacteroides chelonae TaxID=1774 RepID=UPI0008A9135A|nr:hypothetical protein [Mycobacteroides chelonae]OHU23389.1 hypothetical protein BKG77_06905 [Mycobacteroides chelonae]
MGTATIHAEVNLDHWHPTSHLVQLEPPLRRFNPVDGSPQDWEYVVVHIKTPGEWPGNAGADVFPSNAQAEFVTDTMAPISRHEQGSLENVLHQLGYDTQ